MNKGAILFLKKIGLIQCIKPILETLIITTYHMN